MTRTLNDGICTHVVETLASAKVPFVVYSGAAVDDGDAATFANGEWLSKPTMPDTFERLIHQSS